MKKILLLGVLSILLIPLHAHAAAYPDGCTSTTNYSATTGHPCDMQTCQPGDLYDSQTGQPCAQSSLPLGCTLATLFSPITGQKCSVPNLSDDPGQAQYVQNQQQLEQQQSQATNASILAGAAQAQKDKQVNIEIAADQQQLNQLEINDPHSNAQGLGLEQEAAIAQEELAVEQDIQRLQSEL